ncbi:MAG: energy-coupling factor transporter ATPase [Bacilli bacterium]|jgi:energy-coupling factor transport system ATP-binding protein|nr:energy-coupling factor transporter ATPase [Acholeplasmataceae bacterium]
MEINFRKVNFKYDRKSPNNTLDNIDLSINAKGEFIAILGHTGSGKSTLIQHMNALLLPTLGEIEIFEHRIIPKYKNKLKDVRKRVGLVFQFPEYQLFEETILKDVMFGPKNFGLSEKQAREKAEEALNIVGISEDIWHRSPFSLSGGQMRRVAIAGILACEPEVLVLDEPSVGLDPQGRVELMNLLTDIHNKTHKTIILVSHDMNLIARYADRIIVLKDGRIVYDGGKRRLFNNLEMVYDFNLDLPESANIALKLKEKGFIDFKDIPLTIEELANIIKRTLGDIYE